MDTAILVGPDVSTAERLVSILDRDGLPIIAAFWRRPACEDDWRLVIASPAVQQQGSVPTYRRIQDILLASPDARLSLADVSVIGSNNPVIARLRASVPEGFPLDHFDVTVPDESSEQGGSLRLHVFRWAPQVA